MHQIVRGARFENLIRLDPWLPGAYAFVLQQWIDNPAAAEVVMFRNYGIAGSRRRRMIQRYQVRRNQRVRHGAVGEGRSVSTSRKPTSPTPASALVFETA
jgi:hypothetical protein